MSKIRNGFVCVLLMSLTLFSCAAGIKYRTLYQSQVDPTFVFKPGATVGLIPLFWTTNGRANNVDQLFEKVILNYVKIELEARGASVTFIPVEKLREPEPNKIVCVDMEEYPDLTLLCFYLQRSGEINIPAQTGAYINRYWGALTSTGAQTVTTWTLFVGGTLWTGAPEYLQLVWRGEMVKGSPIPDLSEQARMMVRSLFLTKFLKN